MGVLRTQYAETVLDYVMKMAIENVADVSVSHSFMRHANLKLASIGDLLGSNLSKKDDHTKWLCSSSVSGDPGPNQLRIAT